MQKQAQFEQNIERIKNTFIASLGTKADEFEACLERIVNQEDSAQALDGIQLNAHRLRGVAPTFGLDKVGKMAMILEDCVVKMKGPGSSTNDNVEQFLAAFRNLIDTLRQSEYEPAGEQRHTS